MGIYKKFMANKMIKKEKKQVTMDSLISLNEKLQKKKSIRYQLEALSILFPLIESNRNCVNNDSSKLLSIVGHIFQNLDFTNVRYFPNYWNLYQIGINHLFYGKRSGYGAYYFYENNSFFKIQLLYIDDKWSFKVDGIDQKLDDFVFKKKDEKLFGEYFLTKTHILLPKNKEIIIYYDNEIVEIKKMPLNRRSFVLNKESSIIFFDRIYKADDNAEILYEKFHELGYNNINFIIDKNCSDWNRLNKKEFNLIPYGSEEMDTIYNNAKYIISSSLDKEIYNYKNLRYRDFGSASKYIFVPHGVTLNNQSKWFDDKRIDAIISTTDFEYESFLNKYLFFDDEIIRAKMPRFEKLKNNTTQNILLHFTWRKNLDGYSLEEFKKSNYFQKISELINFLKNSRDESITLVLHPQFSKYSSCFNFDNVEILNPTEVIYSVLISNCKVLITDYSSVSIDALYINKSVIFYQFDREEFYSNHIYSEGDFYLDKCKNNICINLEEIKEYLVHNSKIEITYFNNECIGAIERKKTL